MALATVIQIGIYVVAAVCLGAALIFAGRSLTARRNAAQQKFNVGRLNAHKTMMQEVYKALGMLVLALIFLIVGASYPFDGDGEVAINAEPTAGVAADENVVDDNMATEDNGQPADDSNVSSVATDVPAPASPTAESTPLLPTPTLLPATPTPIPTETLEPTPESEVALVNSPVVGLYLRSVPAGEILERLEDQTEVTLTGEEQTLDDIRWVFVETPSGNSGWVAADFLTVGPLNELEIEIEIAPEEGEDGSDTPEANATQAPADNGG